MKSVYRGEKVQRQITGRGRGVVCCVLGRYYSGTLLRLLCVEARKQRRNVHQLRPGQQERDENERGNNNENDKLWSGGETKATEKGEKGGTGRTTTAWGDI